MNLLLGIEDKESRGVRWRYFANSTCIGLWMCEGEGLCVSVRLSGCVCVCVCVCVCECVKGFECSVVCCACLCNKCVI